MRTLLDAGADQSVRDAYSWTPLMRAAHNRRAEIVRLLLEAPGADLSAHQESGATVLHIAAGTGDTGIVRLLVDHGADTSTKDGNGNTAATVASLAGHEALTDYLEVQDGTD